MRGVRGVVYRNSAEFGPPSSELRKVINTVLYTTKCTYPNITNFPKTLVKGILNRRRGCEG